MLVDSTVIKIYATEKKVSLTCDFAKNIQLLAQQNYFLELVSVSKKRFNMGTIV